MQHNISTPEQWRDIPGYEGAYQVSDQGRVRSCDREVNGAYGSRYARPGKIMIQATDRGYKKVPLCKNAKQRHYRVHTLVLAAFVGPRPKGSQVRHLDGKRDNNLLSNLTYGTPSENAQDMVAHGTHNLGRLSQCPRGHKLENPNLMPSALKRGQRSCLACNRTHNYVKRNPAMKGKFKEVSDSYFQQIMAGSKPGKHITIKETP